MKIRKYTDWRSWVEGLWDNAIPAGATAFLTLIGTNGLDQLGLHGIGMNWKQALAQIGVHMGIAAAKYVQQKPRPVVVTEEVDTTTITKPPTP